MKQFFKVLFPVLFLSVFSFSDLFASGGEGEYDPKEFAMHHIADAHEWHIVGNFAIPLPIIVIHDGVHIFSSAKMPDAHHGPVHAEINAIQPIDTSNHHHGSPVITENREVEFYPPTYQGFYYDESGKIHHEDGKFLLDLSITKNVATLLLVSLILILVFTSVAKSYKQREGTAPKGLQSLMEPLIIFVRDEVVKPNLGKKTDRYLPFMLTVFFFIWFSNLLGLIPFISNPNLTGNITVTMALAIMVFLITQLHSNKYYWGHIFNPPGVPGWVKVILVPIEFLGIFIKPVALMIRLFANITAGHIIIISLVGLIFIFGKAGESLGAGLGASIVAIPFAIFMSFLELLVAFLQAFIFTMLSALFISLAQEEHHDAHPETTHH
ncbi:MAG: F0F1 ATP synthase subunit A [Chitinophagales bacterium]